MISTISCLVAACSLVCGESLVAFTVGNEIRTESTRICVNEFNRPSSAAQIQAFTSESCLKRDDRKVDGAKECVAFRKAREVALSPASFIPSKANRIAPARVDLCLRLGGEPESVRFQWKNVWQTSDRCRFDEDFSYLDLMSLSAFTTSPFVDGAER